MHDELWAGVDFKLDESQFFLEQMSKVIVPARFDNLQRHPAYAIEMTRWQPDFYYYLDAFVGAARSVPDVIQKCFGWDERSRGSWVQPLERPEIERRKRFQDEFTSIYAAFHGETLSRVRTGVFHWLGVPPVQTKARLVLGQEYIGGPLELIPSAACREFPPEVAENLPASTFRTLPVEPSWQDFTLEIPQPNAPNRSIPLFEECKRYKETAKDLVSKAKVISERVHGAEPLTQPPAIAPEAT